VPRLTVTVRRRASDSDRSGTDLARRRDHGRGGGPTPCASCTPDSPPPSATVRP